MRSIITVVWVQMHWYWRSETRWLEQQGKGNMRGSGARKAGLQILIKVLLFSYLALFYPPSTSFPGTLILLYYFLSVPARVFFFFVEIQTPRFSVFFLKAFPRRRIRFFLPEFLFGWKFYLRAAEREGLSGLSLRPVTLKLVSNPSSNTRPLWFPLVLHLSTCVLDLLRQGLGNYAIPISMPRGLAGGKL